jgi:hypothetical protein
MEMTARWKFLVAVFVAVRQEESTPPAEEHPEPVAPLTEPRRAA